MILEELPNNVALALFHATMLSLFRGLNPQQAMDAMMTSVFGQPVQGQYVPDDGSNLAFYYAGVPQRRVLYIDGLRTNDQAVALMGGYSQPDIVLAGGGTNIWLLGQAARILGMLVQPNRVDPEYVDFVGYSAGGATCLAAQVQLLIANPLFKTKVLTFGSPRTFGSAGQDASHARSIARWMTPGDPVPLVPLSLDDSPAIAAFTPTPILLAWATFRHAAGGIQVNADGTTAAASLPSDASAAPVASVADWLFGQEGDPNNQHAMRQYVANLQAAVNRLPQPAQQDVRAAPKEDPNPVRSSQVNRERSRIETAIQELGKNQNSIPEVTPEATLFKPVRIGRTWYVALGESIVITAPIRKRAEHIARAGNDFLRSLQKQAVVDPDTLQSQIEIFLQLAQDPSTGFSPTINTEMPT